MSPSGLGSISGEAHLPRRTWDGDGDSDLYVVRYRSRRCGMPFSSSFDPEDSGDVRRHCGQRPTTDPDLSQAGSPTNPVTEHGEADQLFEWAGAF